MSRGVHGKANLWSLLKVMESAAFVNKFEIIQLTAFGKLQAHAVTVQQFIHVKILTKIMYGFAKLMGASRQ